MLNTKLFDHTILKADATEAQVAKICDEALAHDFASVCVNQYYTKFVAEKLKGSDVKVCTVVGFPLGMSDTRVKAFETRAAIEDGAQEVDMVINVGALKDGKYDFVRSDIQTLKEVCGKDIVLKVIIETCLLTEEEKILAFRDSCATQFGDGATLNPANLIDSSRFEVKTADATISVGPEHSYLVETRIIDGRKYLLIPADEDIEVNGFGVRVKGE